MPHAIFEVFNFSNFRSTFCSGEFVPPPKKNPGYAADWQNWMNIGTCFSFDIIEYGNWKLKFISEIKEVKLTREFK